MAPTNKTTLPDKTFENNDDLVEPLVEPLGERKLITSRRLVRGKAFLNGEFTWPPPDWVNPISDEEEEASLKKRFKDYLAEAQTKD
jgi:DNA topoisomerase VI subunit B